MISSSGWIKCMKCKTFFLEELTLLKHLEWKPRQKILFNCAYATVGIMEMAQRKSFYAAEKSHMVLTGSEN